MLRIRIQKTNKKSMINTFIISIIAILAGIINSNHMELAVLTVCLLMIIKQACISYFSVFSFILWFSFLQEYFASINPLLSSGRLRWDTSIPVYILELFICIMFFFVCELVIFNLTDVLKKEKSIYKQKISINKKIAYIYVTVAFLLTLLAYPTLPSLTAELARDQGILSSSLVVPISILLLATVFDYLQKGLYFKILTLLTLFWIMFHGDRVIVLGYAVYFLLKYMNSGKFNFNSMKAILFNKRTLIVFGGIVAVAILSIRVQTTRIGGTYNLSLNELFFNLLKQGTAADVVFAFNCATNMWKIGRCVNGYTYLYYFSNLLPSANPSFSPAVILEKNYNTLGGGLFFAEPMMNGGLFLTFIHSIVFLLLLVWVFDKKSSYRSFLIIPFIILVFRFAWYASLSGLVKMLLYYVPAVYFVSKKFK